MIPGRTKAYRAKHFRSGLRCGVVGCSRRARHQWAYPCAITTMLADPAPAAWIPVCDECDLQLNRRLLEVVGVPAHVLDGLLAAYELIQADAAHS